MLLFHRDLGGAGLPPLVILHGLLGSSRNWQTVGRELAKSFHVYALDLRNHGNSPHEAEMSYAAMADDLREWLDHQQIPEATILGHSLGGKVAMRFACWNPARASRLIVVDIAPRDYTRSLHEAEFLAMRSLDLATLPSRAEAESRLEKFIPDWGMRKFLLTNLERDPNSPGGWRWVVNLPALENALPVILQNPLDVADVFSGPTLFIAGGRSQYLSAPDWPGIAAHFPTYASVVLENSGHNPHIDDRENFVTAVMKFTS